MTKRKTGTKAVRPRKSKVPDAPQGGTFEEPGSAAAKAEENRVESRLPAPIDHAAVVPLSEAVGPVRCIATKEPQWFGLADDRIVLTAKDGHALPNISESGTEVDVHFSPPPVCPAEKSKP